VDKNSSNQVSLNIKWFANQNDSYFIPETKVRHKHKHNQWALNNGFPEWPNFPHNMIPEGIYICFCSLDLFCTIR